MPGIIGAGGVAVNVNTGAETYTFDPDFLASIRAASAATGSYLLNGSPSGTLRENLPGGRFAAVSDTAALTTQVMTSVALRLEVGDVVTNLTFISGATAANTPANWWFGLYDTAATPAKIAQSADQTSTAWAANTKKTLALSAAYTVTTAGTYYAAVMVKATTPPSLAGVTLENAVMVGALISGQYVLAQTSGSSLAATAPSTIASPTTIAAIPYVVAT